MVNIILHTQPDDSPTTTKRQWPHHPASFQSENEACFHVSTRKNKKMSLASQTSLPSAIAASKRALRECEQVRKTLWNKRDIAKLPRRSSQEETKRKHPLMPSCGVFLSRISSSTQSPPPTLALNKHKSTKNKPKTPSPSPHTAIDQHTSLFFPKTKTTKQKHIIFIYFTSFIFII